VEDEKKLTISKIVRFGVYRPVAAIKNNSEENIQIQKMFLSTKNSPHQSGILVFVISIKEPKAAANKILKKKRKYPSIQ